jgi:short-subunit dehydrogenase
MEFNRELALVTGASSGIGAELARLLAARGANLVLTARRLDRLQSLADELTTRHAITATPIASDLNTPDGADRLVEELAARGLNPSILINNAGFGYFSSFTVQPLEEIESLIQVNVRALTILCRKIGQQMAERRSGAILNVSSFAAIAPIPRYAVYSGAKAYVIAFSQALRHELAKKNVKVCVLCPGFTQTEFHEVSGHEKSLLMRATELSAAQVARAGIRGLAANRFLIVPGLWYKLNALTARLLPRTLMSSFSASAVK